MVESPLVVYVGMALLIGLFSFIANKIYQNRDRIGMPALRYLLGVGLCLMLWVVLVIPRPLHLWQRILAACCAPYGMLLYYAAMKQMFCCVCSKSLVKSKAFFVTMLFVLCIIILDICMGENAPVFDSTDPYAASWMFYTEAIVSYAVLLYLSSMIARIYRESLQRITHSIDRCRIRFCFCAFLVNVLGLLLVEINLCLALCGQRVYRVPFNSIYHISLIVTVLLLVCGYVFPERWLVIVLRPFSVYRIRRQQRQQLLLHYLHQMIVKVVPGVQLQCEQLHDLRILIEISDARQIVWSQQQRKRPVSSWDEARHLHFLHKANTVFITSGPYVPAATVLTDTVRHNVLVARRLRWLQKWERAKTAILPIPRRSSKQAKEDLYAA